MLLVLSLHVNAGCCVRTAASCVGDDVGDVGVAGTGEPVDKSRTTIGTQFVVLYLIRLPSLRSCGFLTTSPMVGIPAIFAEFSE